MLIIRLGFGSVVVGVTNRRRDTGTKGRFNPPRLLMGPLIPRRAGQGSRLPSERRGGNRIYDASLGRWVRGFWVGVVFSDFDSPFHLSRPKPSTVTPAPPLKTLRGDGAGGARREIPDRRET